MKTLHHQNPQWVDLFGNRRAAVLGRWLGFFSLVIMALVAWRYWESSRLASHPPGGASAPAASLSAPTLKILNDLSAPVELRFYSASDPARYPESLREFAVRVDRMIGEYQRVSDGKVAVRRLDPRESSSARDSAGADGVLPVANENGEICYLGVVIANGAHRAALPQLNVEWENALEADLSRAIVRVTTVGSVPGVRAGQSASTLKPVDPAISEELWRTFPDLGKRSFDDMAKVLRDGAMTELKSAALDMQTKVQRAQQELAAARRDQSDTAQQAALQALQEVQATQAAKLQEITARLQNRITVLQQLQMAATSTGPAPQQ